MSPKAKVSYDQNKFEVEFNVADYLPEVSGRGWWLGAALAWIGCVCRVLLPIQQLKA